MTFKNFLLILLTVSFLMPSVIQAQEEAVEDWELRIEKDQIKVFNKKNHKTGIKEIRITTTIMATIPELIKILNDVSLYNTWVYKCKSAKKIKSISSNSFQYYLQTDFPFPTSDRDLVIESKQWSDAQSGYYYSHSVAKSDLLPVKAGIVRIKTFESFWKIMPNEDGSVDIDYRAFTDPGGNIPAWIINMGITQGPLKTFQKCIELVEQPTTESVDIGLDIRN